MIHETLDHILPWSEFNGLQVRVEFVPERFETQRKKQSNNKQNCFDLKHWQLKVPYFVIKHSAAIWITLDFSGIEEKNLYRVMFFHISSFLMPTHSASPSSLERPKSAVSSHEGINHLFSVFMLKCANLEF